MSLNGIAHLPYKFQKQQSKLDLAAINKTSDGDPRDSYSITKLPTQYSNTVLLLNCESRDSMLSNGSEYSITVTNTTGPTYSDDNPFIPSVGGSMTFGGSNRYISIAGRNEFAVGTGDFTVDWWQYQTSLATGTFPRVWTINNWPTASIGVSIENGNCLSWINGIYTTTTLDTVLNKWTHIAMVRKAGVVKIYQNGIVKNTYNNSVDITNNTSAMTIGSESGANEGTTKFPGKITNFRFVSGHALYDGNFTLEYHPSTIGKLAHASTLDITRPWNPMSGLQLYIHAGKDDSYNTNSQTWYDMVNDHDATFVNLPTFNTNPPRLSFDSTKSQHATIGNLGDLSNWAIESWFRITSSLSGHCTSIITDQYLNNKLNFSLGTNRFPTNSNICIGFFDTAWRTTTGFVPTLNTWYHVVGTYDGTTLKQYVNGVLNTQLSYTGTSTTGNGEVRIASRWDAQTPDTDFFPGDISVVKIYNRAITLSEITYLYNNTKTTYGL